MLFLWPVEAPGPLLKRFPFSEREAPVRGSRLDFPKGRHCLLTDPQNQRGSSLLCPNLGYYALAVSFLLHVPWEAPARGMCVVPSRLRPDVALFLRPMGEPLVLVCSFPCPFISTPCPRTLDMWSAMITLLDIPSLLSLGPLEQVSDDHYCVSIAL